MTLGLVIEAVGKSTKSWEDAVQQVVKELSKKHKKISCIDIVKMTGNVENGKVTEYKADVKVVILE